MLNLLQQYRRYLPLGLILCGLIFLFLMSSLGVQIPAYSVFIDQQEKFQTDDPEAVNLALQRIIAQERKRCQQDIDLVNQVEMEKVFANRENIVPAEEVEKELRKNLQFEAQATAIVVDGKVIASVKSRELAEKILSNLKREYSWLDEGEELLEITFAEKVELRDTKVPSQEIIEPPQAYQLIKIGTNNPEKYLVKEGDSLWLIARRNDMYVNDIVVANNLNSDKLHLGQELLLVKSKPYITVMTQVKGERVEAIPFQTKVVVDTSVGSTVRVKQEGKNGEKQVVYQATKLNGVLQQKDVKSEKILQAAVDKIIIKGNRVVQVASRSGSGNLEWPSYGPITQYYRGGGHTGLDIGARSGTSIRAADAGYVTSACYQGGYGKFIVINHNNGLVTRYAHCSSIAVSEGQSVSRGEVIGAVGSTGRSSGPHLHFEVLSGGSFQNPLNYLP